VLGKLVTDLYNNNHDYTTTTTDGSSEAPTPQEDSIRDFLQALNYSNDSNAPLSNHQLSVSSLEKTKRPQNLALSALDIPRPFSSHQLQQSAEQELLPLDHQKPTFMTSSATQAVDWQREQHASIDASTAMPLELSNSSTDISSDASIRSDNTAMTTPEWYQTTPSSISAHFPTGFPSASSYQPVCFDSPPTPMSSINISHLSSINRSKFKCEASILSAQEILLRKSDPERSSFDVALAANKEMIKRCSAMIECSCFPCDDSNALTLSSIMARMISIYWARALGLGRSSAKSSDRPLGFGDNGNGFEDGSKRKGMHTIGAYRLDEADEERLKIEIVLIELSKLEKLVSAFQTSFVKAGGAKSTYEMDPSLSPSKTRTSRSRIPYIHSGALWSNS